MSISSPERIAGSLLLLSGGIESATLLAQEAAEHAVTPLVVDYGQRGAARERAAAAAQCRRLGLEPVHLDLSGVGERFREGLDKRPHVPLPHRNLVILALAVSFAARGNIHRVALALNRDDVDAYPSASTTFLDRFRDLVNTLQPGLAISTPLIDLDKSEVIRLGHALGVDLGRTWSCLLGHERHCGACPQCLHRKTAFRAAGIADPTHYRHGDDGA